MWLCSFGTREIEARLDDFEERNGFWAYFWPTVFALLPLIVFWWIVLAPHGTFGLYTSLFTDVQEGLAQPSASTMEAWPRELDVARYIEYLTDNSTALTWVFLGSYFYLLTALVSRWMLLDLTPGLLWRLNARLAVTFIIGLLLSALSPMRGASTAFAFLFGIVPESAFRWLTDGTGFLLRGKRRMFIDLSATAQKVFGVSDLYAIKGLNFWQIDRLMDDGVENIQNLATRDVSQLLVRTRFDTQRLLDWVDQALLIHYVGERIASFRRAGIYTATDFLGALEYGATTPPPQSAILEIPCHSINLEQIKRVLDSLNAQSNLENNHHDAPADIENQSTDESKIVRREHVAHQSGNHHPDGLPPIDGNMLQNLAISLVTGPNYAVLHNYWENTCTKVSRQSCLDELEKVCKETGRSSLREALRMAG
jgi:hypothetical protein